MLKLKGINYVFCPDFLHLRKIGDLTGESLIFKLLQKTFQLEAPFSLIEDTEDSFKGVILIVGRRDLPIF